jgi:hypothetical protein
MLFKRTRQSRETIQDRLSLYCKTQASWQYPDLPKLFAFPSLLIRRERSLRIIALWHASLNDWVTIKAVKTHGIARLTLTDWQG